MSWQISSQNLLSQGSCTSKFKPAFVVMCKQSDEFGQGWRVDLLRQHGVEFLEKVVQLHPHVSIEHACVAAGLLSGDCVHLRGVPAEAPRPSKFSCALHLPATSRDELIGATFSPLTFSSMRYRYSSTKVSE